MVTDHHYDVAVLDVKMPGIGGIDLERKLRGLALDMKIIFLTGHGSEIDFDIGSTESARYLSKPINIEKFMQLYRVILEDIAGNPGKKIGEYQYSLSRQKKQIKLW